MSLEVTVREAARVILVNARGEALLFRAEFPAWGDGDEAQSFWITPGGGVDPGEDYVAAAVREVWEETGLRDAELGPCCWLRTHTFRFRDSMIEQRERYFLCRVEEHEVAAGDLQEEESEFLVEHRWWNAAGIRNSAERFVPGDFADLLESLLADGPPAAPITVGL